MQRAMSTSRFPQNSYQPEEEVPWLAPIEFDPLPSGIWLGANGRSLCDRLWASLTERRMPTRSGCSLRAVSWQGIRPSSPPSSIWAPSPVSGTRLCAGLSSKTVD